jgi:crotonobetainyl-CoA:carnitine CoA-transferase CaiB-like acyl-CoA transferase
VISSHPDAVAQPPASSGGALQGLRVLDLSRVIAGPWCAQILADLGADVVKVERPHEGDDSRSWAPPYMKDPEGRDTPVSVSFAACNRGKRSLALNFADSAQAAILRELAAQADVLVENYKYGTLARYGLDHVSLSALNPRLIYCSITGFGHTGPYRDRPGYDTIIQGMSGLMSITGQPDGEPGGGPLKAGLPVIDLMTGQYAAIAILAALQHRQATGAGQHLDLALLDVGVSSLAHLGLRFLTGGGPPQRHGNRLPMVAPSDAYGCKDGRVMLIVGNDAQFLRLCQVMSVPELAVDERFATNAQRLANARALDDRLTTAFSRLTVEECVRICSDAGVPCGPIHDVAQVFADPQVVARGLAGRVADANGRTAPTVLSPLRMSATPPRPGGAAPTLGSLVLTPDDQGRIAWPD